MDQVDQPNLVDPAGPGLAAPTGGGGLRGQASAGARRLRSGDLGSAPIIVGLLLIVVIFQISTPTFLSSANLVSLSSQIASTGIIAVGVVLMLLLGEIDLSVGSVSGAAAAVLAVSNVKHGLSPAVSIGIVLATGVVIGLLHGLVFTKFGVPSFVVTLAGLLVWLGLQRRVLSSTGTINLPRHGWLLDVGQFKYFGYLGAGVIAALLLVAYLVPALAARHRRTAMGLPSRSLGGIGVTALGIAVVSALVIYSLCQDLGVPWIFVFFLVLVVLVDWVLRRTRYGRHVFAIGGNIEAARRSGIRVDTIRCSVFVLCSVLAATGGVVEAMRAGSAGRDTGTGDVLINAIAAAVIGGTSLFGGRTRRFAALLGILVIGSIPNGLNLLNLSDDLRFIITGSVLIAAVIVDALSRRGRQASGAG
ncbi:MAG TPA: sugar ABC transporter permease [Mycobacteriales bacterium]|nr:sugar ABC transporter permease [Mycobacteriales bacterium]